jgi:hypothetical protein
MENFDLDIGLRDAACDPELLPQQRTVANLCLGMDIDDAYLSVRELYQAIDWVHHGVPEGRAKLAGLLSNRCDDFQRALYYALAGRGIVDMLDTLGWLAELLKARGRVAAALSRARIGRRALVSPYVAAEPDGPLVSSDPGFELGAAWAADCGPRPS